MDRLEVLINRLHKAKGKNGTWTACCPAHKDDSPSLAVRALDDGRILLHCFAGCSVDSVLAALGMDWSDLFSPDEKREYVGHYKPPAKPLFYATDLLRILSMESMVVLIAASDIRAGKGISEEDRQRLLVAQQRIEEVMHHAGI